MTADLRFRCEINIGLWVTAQDENAATDRANHFFQTLEELLALARDSDLAIEPIKVSHERT